MVIYVVKNASRPKPVIFTGPGREAFSRFCLSHCNSEGGVMQVLSVRFAAQILRRYKQGNKALERDSLYFFLRFAIVAFGEVLFPKLP